MPRGASPKRERQYEHIKQSARKSGRYGGRAEEVAARTVNKIRSEKGETKTKRTGSKKALGASSSKPPKAKPRAATSRSTRSRGLAKKSPASRSGRGRSSPTSHRLAGMTEQRQREIAAQGGRAAHKQGTAHEFSKAEARKAGQKGGEAVSRNRSHMAEIGRRGGER